MVVILFALIVNSRDHPVKGFDTVPLQSRLALMSTWLMTQPPSVWSLNPLCMNESQNSLPCVEVFCAINAGRLPKKRSNNAKTDFKCFIVFCLINGYFSMTTFLAMVPSLLVATKK